jgi:anthranilate 1,2-dioxygenase small subunit
MTEVWPLNVRIAVTDLLIEYAALIDDDRLEEWLELFTDDCVYRVIPRENEDQGLPAAIILCTNRNMLRDRVVSLREACEYNIHTDRHVLSPPRLIGRDGDLYTVETSYAAFQTDQEGESRLFSVGRYRDRIVYADRGPKFKEKTVIVDTATVPTLLATPL